MTNKFITFGQDEGAFLRSMSDRAIHLADGGGIDIDFIILQDKLVQWRVRAGTNTWAGNEGTFLIVGRDTPVRASSG